MNLAWKLSKAIFKMSFFHLCNKGVDQIIENKYSLLVTFAKNKLYYLFISSLKKVLCFRYKIILLKNYNINVNFFAFPNNNLLCRLHWTKLKPQKIPTVKTGNPVQSLFGLRLSLFMRFCSASTACLLYYPVGNGNLLWGLVSSRLLFFYKILYHVQSIFTSHSW